MILIITAMTTVSTTTITITSIASIAITTNNMIYCLFLLSLQQFVEAGSNMCSLKDFQFLTEKTEIILVGTFSQEITSYAKRGNSIYLSLHLGSEQWLELKKKETETNRDWQIWLSFVRDIYEPLQALGRCRSNQTVLPLDLGRHNERGEQVARPFMHRGLVNICWQTGLALAHKSEWGFIKHSFCFRSLIHFNYVSTGQRGLGGCGKMNGMPGGEGRMWGCPVCGSRKGALHAPSPRAPSPPSSSHPSSNEFCTGHFLWD